MNDFEQLLYLIIPVLDKELCFGLFLSYFGYLDASPARFEMRHLK